jgi:hypothetical protein
MVELIKVYPARENCQPQIMRVINIPGARFPAMRAMAMRMDHAKLKTKPQPFAAVEFPLT